MTAKTSDTAHAGHHRLIFRWPERSASFVLPVVFLLSVLVHAITFYVFQVVYPPTVSIAPPPAQVTLLTPSTPQNEALLRWVDSQDPAIAGAVKAVVPQGLGEIAYVPSYANAHTHPVPIADSTAPVDYLPAHDPLAITAPVTAPKTIPRTQVRSSLLFSRSLRDRTPPQLPAMTFPVKATLGLQHTVFLIAVSDRGEVRYTFLQRSSGDRNIDTVAENALTQCDFAKSDAPLTWGYAIFNWGAEAYAAPTPTPATTE